MILAILFFASKKFISLNSIMVGNVKGNKDAY